MPYVFDARSHDPENCIGCGRPLPGDPDERIPYALDLDNEHCPIPGLAACLVCATLAPLTGAVYVDPGAALVWLNDRMIPGLEEVKAMAGANPAGVSRVIASFIVARRLPVAVASRDAIRAWLAPFEPAAEQIVNADPAELKARMAEDEQGFITLLCGGCGERHRLTELDESFPIEALEALSRAWNS